MPKPQSLIFRIGLPALQSESATASLEDRSSNLIKLPAQPLARSEDGRSQSVLTLLEDRSSSF